MIYVKDKEVTAITVTKKAIAAFYWGARLVWQAVTSLCDWFRSEGWHRSDPW